MENFNEIQRTAFYQSYIRYLASGFVSKPFHIIDSRGIRGLAVDVQKPESLDAWKGFNQYIVERHRSIGYVLKNTKESKPDESFQLRNYLKPSIRLQMSTPAEQLFGNITVEISSLDDERFRFKCQSTYYQDFQFKKARSFDEWMATIFDLQAFNL